MALEYICEGIDRLVTLDLKGRCNIYSTHDAANKIAGMPAVRLAAQRITSAMEGGGTALITTGFRIPPKNIQETDGPPGAAALARILGLLFNANTLMVTEEASIGMLTVALKAIGVRLVAAEKLGSVGVKNSVAVMGFPIEPKDAEREAKRILGEYKPSLVLAIEKAGRNSKGEYHTWRGVNISAQHAKVEPLIEEARNRRILTVGIGDTGNEVGMGNIKETVEKSVPYANNCQCPCGGGTAAESKVDVLVAAAISNWGAYGIEACLAYLAGRPDALHDSRLEESMLKKMVDAGSIDGITGLNEFSVDNVPGALHMAVVDMLNELIGT